MKRFPAVLMALLVAVGGLLVAPSPAQAAPTQPQVELLTARLGSAGRQVFLRYQFTCPPSGQASYLAAKISQTFEDDVDVAREFLEVRCDGQSQRGRLVVPVREGRFVPGTSLIETELNQDNEPASWRADETVVADLRDEKVGPTRITANSLAGLRTTSPRPLNADIGILGAEILANGAGLKVTYEARCPQDYFTYVFSQVQQAVGPRNLDARGTLSAFCAGGDEWQRLVAVVSLNDGPPFVAGSVTIKGVLNNCPEEVGCFLASDEQDLLLGSGTGQS